MHAFPVTVIDTDGKRHQFEQLATTRRQAESLVIEQFFGQFRYIFVRSAS